MVRRQGRRSVIAMVGFVLSLAQPAPRAHAADIEQRDFAILVNGKEAGQSRITITVDNDGATVVAVSAKVKLSQLFINYSYNVESTEWWKAGKLTGLRASSVENGKSNEVVAAGD